MKTRQKCSNKMWMAVIVYNFVINWILFNLQAKASPCWSAHKTPMTPCSVMLPRQITKTWVVLRARKQIFKAVLIITYMSSKCDSSVFSIVNWNSGNSFTYFCPLLNYVVCDNTSETISLECSGRVNPRWH